MDRPRPWFARMYERITPGMEVEGLAELRRELLADLTGVVVEVGAGNGMNFAQYPPTVTSVVAVEPEPHLRGLAERAAAEVDVPVTVVPGRAQRLPVEDRGADAGVVSLVLCALNDESLALRELHRVIRPGGQLRFRRPSGCQASTSIEWPQVSGRIYAGCPGCAVAVGGSRRVPAAGRPCRTLGMQRDVIGTTRRLRQRYGDVVGVRPPAFLPRTPTLVVHAREPAGAARR